MPQKSAGASVMVLPSRGSERGAVTDLGSLEKALLRRGVRVISSGVTGRVVVDGAEGKRGGDTATQLSELERALVLARKSNADATLQAIETGWRDDLLAVDRYHWFDVKRWHELAKTRPSISRSRPVGEVESEVLLRSTQEVTRARQAADLDFVGAAAAPVMTARISARSSSVGRPQPSR